MAFKMEGRGGSEPMALKCRNEEEMSLCLLKCMNEEDTSLWLLKSRDEEDTSL